MNIDLRPIFVSMLVPPCMAKSHEGALFHAFTHVRYLTSKPTNPITMKACHLLLEILSALFHIDAPGAVPNIILSQFLFTSEGLQCKVRVYSKLGIADRLLPFGYMRAVSTLPPTTSI
jgi:hypothetical protein